MIPPETRASLYRLLARLITAAPDAALIALLRSPDVAAVLAEAEPDLRLEDDNLHVEFARLFLLPKGVPPYASAWLEGDRERLATQLATLSHRAMVALDLQQTHAEGNLSLDHLGLLLSMAAAALERPQTAALGAHLEAQLLGTWVNRFAEALIQRAAHPLYRATGHLLLATRAPA